MTKPASLQSSWTLAEGVEFLTALQSHLKPLWFVGLTGSVLYKGGKSDNDLDILIYPASTESIDYDGLEKQLRAFKMRRLIPTSVVHARWRKLGSNDTKRVEVWTWGDKKLDIFFVQ